MTVVNFCNSFYYKNKSTNENYTYCHSLYLHDARPIFLMPDTQSVEKQSALRGMGAELRTVPAVPYKNPDNRSEEHTSELQSLMRISYAVLCLKKKTNDNMLMLHSQN